MDDRDPGLSRDREALLAEELAAFQAALLEILAEGHAPDETQRRVLAHPTSVPYRDWVASWDLRCVETAVLLVEKRGRRRP